jgi:predicted DCC family thiol-disulfide oxidoreductase YuxK
MNNDKLILFDGVCNLCNGGVQFIIKKDSKAIFKFASLQSSTGQHLLQKFNLPLTDFNSFVYIKNGNYMLKSTAILHILKDLGNGWQLLYGFIIIPRFIRDGIYFLIEKNRYKLFGKRETCMVPTPEIKSRFLDI